ncbi:adenine deaminase [Methanobrevibacter sp. TMH8]|uniref:adenine deaminase n=1 Tax=Methanobrevibacter sp. TMH8 TaxID=2848611 RepID=UPI001CCEB04F|nr:adenine deaminase [Methanobrevibacter sp. TMH8]MBZ9570315.1 adenine deaminase [Methanobrevibacter sp. TMH8]
MNYTKIKKIKTNILDIAGNEIYPAEVSIKDGYFKKIMPLENDSNLDFDGIMVPGFIDAHIHIESSLLTPSNFAKAVVPYGTTSVIADPHEIANVCGIKGIDFMIEDASLIPFDFYFSAPSCVPATNFETNGACLDCEAIKELMEKDEVVALGEVMNFVGVINRDNEVICKLNVAEKYKKPIDGHAPMLSGKDLEEYVNVGNISISTDHESVSFDEAIEKKKLGMKIMVREGSSAKNMEALFNIKDRIGLCSNQDFFGSVSVADFQSVLKYPIFDFLVSDDKHPNDLKEGHLNVLIKKTIDFGIDPIETIKMVTINPAEHYNLNSGSIEEDKKANFVLIDNLNDFNIKKTYIGGYLVAEDGKSYIDSKKSDMGNTFRLNKKNPDDFEVIAGDNFSASSVNVRVIELVKDEIITNEIDVDLFVENDLIQEDIDDDILKLAVVERYGDNNISNAFIKGFGLKKGAIASSVAHDSHNIIVVGTNSNDMARAVNLISENKGGLAVVIGDDEKILKLPIAGLMSDENVFTVSDQLENINNKVATLGSSLEAPFMTLSFMALLVIPNLRLSDKGLFDVNKFCFVNLVKG